MFETTVVRAHAIAAPRRAALVSVSLVAHVTFIGAAIAASIVSVKFPRNAPDQFAFFEAVAPVTVPPPLGTPDGGHAQAPPQQKPQTQAPQPAPTQITAPSTVPTETPTLEPSTGAGESTASSTGNSGPVGVPWGDPNGVGDPNALPTSGMPGTATAAPEPAIYRVGGDVKPPRVISRVEPKYPPAFSRIGKTAVVRVHCVVDKYGRVQNPQIVVSSFAPFNEAVLAAIEQWRFQPGSLNGTAVDTYFELTVTFSTSH